MLKTTKGNLLCFQWEVERFQRSHREKMAAVAAQTSNKPGSLPRRRDELRKAANVDVRRQNSLLVAERTSRVHGAGGCQRRSLQESQGVKTVLEFGKTSEALSRAASKRRASLRKRKQECVRRENAKLFTRLASPKRSGIDFSKFEAEFSESRARHRMIHCDRTVGHTLVYSAAHTREPPFSGEDLTTTVCERARRRKEPPRRKGAINPEANAPAWERVACGPQEDQSTDAHRLFPTRRPLSARLSPRRPPSDPGIQGADCRGCRYDEARNNARVMAVNNDEEADVTAHGGAQTPSRHRHGSGAYRPHTALGLRRAPDQPDLLEARATDPGWASNGAYSATRPLSAPTKGSRKSWRMAETGCSHQSPPSQTLAGKSARTYHPMSSTKNEPRKVHGAQNGENKPEDGLQYSENKCFFGRTLLAEAKVLVDGNPKTNARRRTKVTLKCSSLDGLMRQQGRVRKTLQGFVVEASIASRPHSAGEGADRVSSSSVAVSVVQDFLEESSSRNVGTRLAPFREAIPLDDRGNYPELTALMGKADQRDLYQTLLGSCRVVTTIDGAIGLEFPRINTGLGMSAIVETPGVGPHRTNFPRPRRPESAKRGEPLPIGTGDRVYRARAVRRGRRGGSGQRNSGAKENHGELPVSDGGGCVIFCCTSSEEQEEAKEPPVVAAVRSPSVPHTPREPSVEHTSESEIYPTLSDEEVEEVGGEAEEEAVEEEEEEEGEDDDDEQRHESDFS